MSNWLRAKVWRWLRKGRKPEAGVEFEWLCLRVTEILPGGKLGRVLVRECDPLIRLTPVIKEGKTYNDPGPPKTRFKYPDEFQRWDMLMRIRWMKLGPISFAHNKIAALGEREFSELLTSGDVAIEGWSKNITGSSQDPTHPWIHWLFARTRWTALSPDHMVFSGVSLPDGPTFYAPDDLPVATSAFWKTDEPPPTWPL